MLSYCYPKGNEKFRISAMICKKKESETEIMMLLHGRCRLWWQPCLRRFRVGYPNIYTYASGHSRCIVAEDRQATGVCGRQVDATCVYINAPVSFISEARFGLDAGMGILLQSTSA